MEYVAIVMSPDDAHIATLAVRDGSPLEMALPPTMVGVDSLCREDSMAAHPSQPIPMRTATFFVDLEETELANMAHEREDILIYRQVNYDVRWDREQDYHG